MTNDFSNIPAETPLRDEITVRSDEFDPSADYDPTVEGESLEDEGTVTETEPDESMDGDFDSGMASAGMGYDEQYEHNLCDDYSGE